MRLKALLLSIAVALAAQGAAPAEEARERLSQLPLHPVEGLWQLPGSDALLEIVRDSVTPGGVVARYRIAVVEHPAMLLAPGTVIGTVTPTAVRGTFDARIFTDLLPGSRLMPATPRKTTLTLSDDETTIIARRYGRSVTIKWWRLLPYMWRWTFSVKKDEPPATDGLLRVYPEPSVPINPIYL